jgi:hypothetical protein
MAALQARASGRRGIGVFCGLERGDGDPWIGRWTSADRDPRNIQICVVQIGAEFHPCLILRAQFVRRLT